MQSVTSIVQYGLFSRPAMKDLLSMYCKCVLEKGDEVYVISLLIKQQWYRLFGKVLEFT